MHVVGIRNDVVEKHPHLPAPIYDAFLKAKQLALADLERLAAFAITLPWVEAEYRATQAVLGPDIWPYGVAQNRKAIETLCRYLHEQGSTKRVMPVDELFVPMHI
jgi:4,5-dihydroxyphthalate decarboxylase